MTIRPAAALLGLVLFFYADKLLLGPWAAVRVHDVFEVDYSRYQIYGELLLKHGPFAWMPHFAGGMPSYAWQHPPYYVLCLLARFLPMWLIYHAVVIALMAAAAWGMFRFLRERMDVSEERAVAWAGLFALATQLQPDGVPENVLSFCIPLFYVWSVEAWERRSTRALLGLWAIMLLSYPVLALPHFTLLHFAIPLVDRQLEPGERWPLWGWFTALWGGYVLLNAPVIYSLFMYAPQAARHFEPWAFPDWAAFKSFVVALGHVALMCGVPTLALGPALAGRRSKALVLLGAIWLVSGVFASDLYHVLAGTIFQKMDLNHFYWLIPFAVILAAAEGFDSLSTKRLGVGAAAFIVLAAARQIPVGLAVLNLLSIAAVWAALETKRAEALLESASAPWLASLALILLFAVFPPQFFAIPSALLGAGLAGAWWRGGRRAGLAALALLVAFPVRLARFHGDQAEERPYRRLVRHESLAAARAGLWEPARAGVVGDDITPDLLARYGWETVEARASLLNRRYKDVFKLAVEPEFRSPGQEAFFDWYHYQLYLMQRGTAEADLNLNILALANTKYLFARKEQPQLRLAGCVETREPSDWARFWDRVCSRVGRASAFAEARLRAISRPDYLYRYEVPGFLSRGFIARDAVALDDDAAVLAALDKASAPRLGEAVFFSKRDGGKPLEGFPGTATVERYEPDHLAFRARTTGPSYLVVTNNFHENWRAVVDGAPAQVLRADHAFQAVALTSAGEHVVTLDFVDPYLRPAHAGLLVGMLPFLLPFARRTV